MSCVGCGTVNLGTEAEPIVVGEANGAPAVEVVLRSPILPGSSYGQHAWVTGTYVEPYSGEGGFFERVPSPATAAPETAAKATTKSADGATTTKGSDV